MKLIVGLGNPGEEYENTRHNAGYAVVDAIAKTCDASWTTETKRFCLKAECSLDGEKIILAKPTTYMNLSGRAVSALASFYKVPDNDILIVQDELDIEPGCFVFSKGGRAGGHHGIESIQELMPEVEVSRLRIGIGKPDKDKEPERQMKDWVLSKPKGKEREAFEKAIEDAADAAQDWIRHGLETSMNRWNSRKKIA